MTVLPSYWCWDSSRKFSECILTWNYLNFEYLIADVWKRPRSWRCSPTSTTTTATVYWATLGSTDTNHASVGAESAKPTGWWSTAWQAWWIPEGPSPSVLSWHGSLLQSSELLLLELYQSLWYVVGSKILSKLLPDDRRSIGGTSILEWLPPVLSFSLELSWSVQQLLLIIALLYVKLLLHFTKSIIYFQWISGMREH